MPTGTKGADRDGVKEVSVDRKFLPERLRNYYLRPTENLQPNYNQKMRYLPNLVIFTSC
jgi:hypothetical protein